VKAIKKIRFHKILPAIKDRTDKVLQKWKKYQFNSRIIKIRNQVAKEVQNKLDTKGQKILFGMSFSICEPCKVHDFLLAQSLMLRGSKIVPLICGATQKGQCTVFGGIWGGYKEGVDFDKDISNKNCEFCIKSDRSLWKEWCGLDPVLLSTYLNEEEKQKVKDLLSTYDFDNYKKWVYDDMPIGQWALDVLRNNFLVGDEKKIKNYKPKFLGYVYNVLLIVKALNNALDDICPDIIVSNDSFYYPWSILEKLAQKKNIPFYSCWVGGVKGRSFYAKDDAAAKFDLNDPWKTWKDKQFSHEEEIFMDKFLKDRVSGGEMILNTANPAQNATQLIEEEIPFNLDSKSTVLLTANVIWDLAALNKDFLFEGMVNWVFEVIEFFEDNPQWQLIIKPHPVEESKFIPQTKQQVVSEIEEMFKSGLPANIAVLKPRTKYSVYDLFPHIRVGLVYTTTAGLEMISAGIPVVTAGLSPYYGKGFSYDAKDKKEYFEILKNLLTTDSYAKNKQKYAEQARKFFYLYYFRYFMKLNLFDYNCSGISDLKVKGAKDLRPGVNESLDYLCDSILNHLPIVSETRCPPFVE